MTSRFGTFGPKFFRAHGSLALIGALLAGCGGGGGSALPGGGSTTGPTPSPTPIMGTACSTASVAGPLPTFHPGNLPAPNQLNPTVVTIDSNPEALPIVLNSTPFGQTPTTTSPQYAMNAYQIVVGSVNPYTFNYSQIGGGSATLYYNQQADSTARLGTIATSGFARGAEGALRRDGAIGETLVRRMPQRIRGNLMKSDRLAVRYHVAALQSTGRTARDIESFEHISAGGDIGPASGGEQTRVVMVPAGGSIDQLAARLKMHPEVASVDRVALRFVKSSVAVTVNDTHYDTYDQWYLFQTGVPNAWAYTCGAPSVPVAIIDTGFDSHHQDLAGKVSYAENDVNSVTGGVQVGLSAADDTDGHGTNVSGIAAADTNNSFGFAGVGYNVTLMEFKIFPDTANAGAGTDDEAQAIYDAVAQGARVISLSIGSTEDQGPDPLEHDAIEYAIAHNVLVVAAAGNETLNTMDFPGGYPGVMAVGATSLNDHNSQNPAGATEYVASYSNYGAGLGIVAPGGDPNGSLDNDFLHWIYNIYTTTPLDPTQACHNISDCKALFAGTSQATPHVSGAAGLLLSRNPNLSAAQVFQILQSTADNINDTKQGPGRVNVYRAMASVAGDTPPTLPQLNNFVAIAYTPGANNRPTILDVTYPKGVRADTNGNFRIADVRPGQTYRIGLWYDANGDGIVDAGDWFGAGPTCSSSSSCNAGSINVAPVPPGFILQ